MANVKKKCLRCGKWTRDMGKICAACRAILDKGGRGLDLIRRFDV